jgi:hypothetical protein
MAADETLMSHPKQNDISVHKKRNVQKEHNSRFYQFSYSVIFEKIIMRGLE